MQTTAKLREKYLNKWKIISRVMSMSVSLTKRIKRSVDVFTKIVQITGFTMKPSMKVKCQWKCQFPSTQLLVEFIVHWTKYWSINRYVHNVKQRLYSDKYIYCQTASNTGTIRTSTNFFYYRNYHLNAFLHSGAFCSHAFCSIGTFLFTQINVERRTNHYLLNELFKKCLIYLFFIKTYLL